MRKFILLLFLITPLLAQSSVEKRVLESVQNMIRQDGQVNFSNLHNSKDLSTAEKLFVGRLYEIFFQIPAFLKVEYESMQRVPTIKEIAASFGITRQSVTLLLSVMQSDRRMPNLFSRDTATGEIESLRLNQIEAFIASRGTNIKITQWELQPLPKFKMIGFQGEILRSTDLTGKNTLLYFWFTGCPPCVRIAPILENLNNRYKNTNFQVIGINADRVLSLNTTDSTRRSYLESHNLNFTNVHLNKSTLDAFGNIQVFPTLFFVSSDGTIRHHLINFQNRNILDELTQKLLEDFQ